MAVKNYIQAVPLLTVANGSLNNSTYTLMGNLDQACFTIKILNDTDGDLLLSYNGVDDHDRIESINSFTTEPHFIEIPVAAAVLAAGDRSLWRKGQPIYAKYEGSAASTGNVYLSGYYFEL